MKTNLERTTEPQSQSKYDQLQENLTQFRGEMSDLESRRAAAQQLADSLGKEIQKAESELQESLIVDIETKRALAHADVSRLSSLIRMKTRLCDVAEESLKAEEVSILAERRGKTRLRLREILKPLLDESVKALTAVQEIDGFRAEFEAWQQSFDNRSPSSRMFWSIFCLLVDQTMNWKSDFLANCVRDFEDAAPDQMTPAMTAFLAESTIAANDQARERAQVNAAAPERTRALPFGAWGR